jgi:hypothetical protein
MKTLLSLGVWCLLFALCWPLAVLALILPAGLASVAALPPMASIEAAFALIRTLLFLPARLLGWRRCPCRV